MLDMRDTPLGQLDDLLVSPDESRIQIRRLEMYLPSRNKEKVLRTILNGHSDELNEIILIQKGDRVNDIPVPHVKRLYIDRLPTSWSRTSPLQQLTILRITGDLHWEMLDLILSQCIVLQKLYVSLAEAGLGSESDIAFKRPTTHSHLNYLGLSYDPPEQELPMDLLSNISFPSLNIFECRLGPWVPSAEESEPTCTPADWFLSLSFLGQLKRLSFSPDLKVSHDFYDSLLSLTDSVEELSFFFYLKAESKPEIFEALTTIFCSSKSPRRLPKLKHLHFSSVGSLTSTSDEILRVGQSSASTMSCKNSQEQPQSSSLSFHYYQLRSKVDEQDDVKRLELLMVLREKCPELQVQFNCHADELSVWIAGFPLVFEMYPLAFSEVREYQVMDQTGNWTRESGPIYRIV